MNVIYKCNNGNAFISADGVNRMMASYEDVEQLLIYENLIEMLDYFYHRDKRELFYLDGKKHTLDKAQVVTGATAVASSIVAPMLTSEIIGNEFAAGLSLGILSTGAVVCLLNEIVLPHNKAREGIRECINYEKQKIEELNCKIECIKKTSKVDKSIKEDTLIDDRDEKKRIQDVLNFIFYLGANKNKVYRMYRDMTLYRYLREKLQITDLRTLSEIETYVYCTFEDKIEKGNSYVKKGN